MPDRLLRFSILLLASAALSAASAKAQPGRSVDIVATPVGMHTPAQESAARSVGKLDFVGGMELAGADEVFGGLSGLEISEDGSRLLAITDRGHWLALDLALDEKGVPRDIGAARMAPILDPEGEAFEGAFRDAEAMLLEDAGVLLSFEGSHRLHRYPAERPVLEPETLFASKGAFLRLPLRLRRQPRNGGIEAMVRLGGDRLLLFSERETAEKGGLMAWIWPGRGEAQPLYFEPPEGFAPTDAAPLPGGDILVLLRRFSPLTGVAASLMRIDAAAAVPEQPFSGEVLATLSPPLTVDNMEGLAVRRGSDGRTWLYLVSDNNFRSLQRTLLLIYALEEPAA